jgi:hypothetical protein
MNNALVNNFVAGKFRVPMTAKRSGRKSNGALAFLILAAFLFANVLAAAPTLHEKIDGASAAHECVVTLIATGKYQQGNAPPLIFAPQPAAQFSKIPALNPIWVAAPFFGAAIFEHAPPAIS